LAGKVFKGGIKAHSSLGEVPDFCRGLGRRESEVAEAGFEITAFAEIILNNEIATS